MKGWKEVNSAWYIETQASFIRCRASDIAGLLFKLRWVALPTYILSYPSRFNVFAAVTFPFFSGGNGHFSFSLHKIVAEGFKPTEEMTLIHLVPAMSMKTLICFLLSLSIVSLALSRVTQSQHDGKVHSVWCWFVVVYLTHSSGSYVLCRGVDVTDKGLSF